MLLNKYSPTVLQIRRFLIRIPDPQAKISDYPWRDEQSCSSCREGDDRGSPARLVSSHNGEQSNHANDIHEKDHE